MLAALLSCLLQRCNGICQHLQRCAAQRVHHLLVGDVDRKLSWLSKSRCSGSMRITVTGTLLQPDVSGRVLGLQMIPKDCRPMLALDTLAASIAAKDALPAARHWQNT